MDLSEPGPRENKGIQLERDLKTLSRKKQSSAWEGRSRSSYLKVFIETKVLFFFCCYVFPKERNTGIF
jgi:hypothetical protein